MPSPDPRLSRAEIGRRAPTTTFEHSTSMARNDLLLRRICGEFLEMPGLRLTGAQAQRLWGLDQSTCLELLEFLVDASFLCRRRDGMYMRLADGRESRPPSVMAKAVGENGVSREKEAL